MVPSALAPMVDRRTRRLLGAYALSAVGAGLPWPLLFVLTWEHTHEDTAVALVGGARLLPYVLLSWWTARLADRFPRDRVIRVTLALRVVASVAALALVLGGNLVGAVLCCSLLVAVGTPTYPAVAAALPAQTARLRSATTCLVTIEASGFVVGPAAGGLLLDASVRWVVPSLAVLLAVSALATFGTTRLSAAPPSGGETSIAATGVVRLVARDRAVAGAIALMAVVNLADGIVGVTLVPLSQEGWRETAAAFGVATAFLGFGALGAPLLAVVGDGPRSRARVGILGCAVSLGLVAPTPAAAWALLPLALAGATSVLVESAATEMLQEQVVDRLRASILGLTDAVIVAAALVGALSAPLVVGVVGPRGSMVVVAAGLAGAVLLLAPVRGSSSASRREERRDPVGGCRPGHG